MTGVVGCDLEGELELRAYFVRPISGLRVLIEGGTGFLSRGEEMTMT